ncbi:aspartate-semialdehyde dehydrogenase [Shewanella salipaludis]|nr:aspartate-semialdehyde dehydrogenase [Shewanella salipaludis]
MDLISLNRHLLGNAGKNNFAGYDPFDGLNSGLFRLFPRLKQGLFGLAWIQLNKRSVLNLRPLLAVPKGRNPKGIALFILGMLEDYHRTQDEGYLVQARELADWLQSQQSDVSVWQHACWGYHFDWNARAFFVPKGKPNVITTIYVAQALFALFQATQEKRYRDLAFDAAHFIVKTLYTEHEGRKFFAYIPGETAFVHNASLWGAAWVARVAAETGNHEYAQMALTVARQSVALQEVNGSWVYGARHHHQFIDGFHTGYNLEALHSLQQALGTDEFDEAIQLGLAYYKAELFDEDGTARYYQNNRYPLDMHSVAQAMITLLRVGGAKEDLALARRVLDCSIRQMYQPAKGRFSYQKHKFFSNKINYMRWTQAWVYYSFAYFNRVTQDADANH